MSATAQAETLLGHHFTNPHLLSEALTHRSAAGPKGRGSNERLEFIGDRVFGLIIAEWLIERFPAEQEGALGPRMAALVSKPSLALIAESSGLPALLNVAAGEAKRGVRENPTVLADAMEALIGGLYLDAGLPPARAFIRQVFAPLMEGHLTPPKDKKTALQEFALARSKDLPDYQIVEQTGPSHQPHFTISVRVGETTATGAAGSKRAAEQQAAAALLAILNP